MSISVSRPRIPASSSRHFFSLPTAVTARAGRHEQQLDAERVPRAEQFTRDGVPEREREHAAQPGQRLGTPLFEGGDDRLAVSIGGEAGPPKIVHNSSRSSRSVVDLPVEHQHHNGPAHRRPPAPRLVGVRDVDDGSR